jgi:hypothetical protein
VGDSLVEVGPPDATIFDAFRVYKWQYCNLNPKIGAFFVVLLGSKCRHLFFSGIGIILTPFLILYFVNGSKLSIKSYKDFIIFSLILTMFWIAIPKIGAMFFYRPFNISYVFSTACLLIFLIPYRVSFNAPLSNKTSKKLFFIMSILGFIAGLGNQHTIPSMIILIAIYIFFTLYQKRFQFWMGTGFAGLFFGYCALFFAPGHTARFEKMEKLGKLQNIAGHSNLLDRLMDSAINGMVNIPSIFIDFIKNSNYLIIICIILTILCYFSMQKIYKNYKILFLSLSMLCSCIFCIGILYVSPIIEYRLFYGPTIFLICSFTVVLDYIIKASSKETKVFLHLLLIISLGYNASQLYEGFQSFKKYSVDVNNRIHEMLSDNASGGFRYIRKSGATNDKWHYDDGLTSFLQRIALGDKYGFDWVSIGPRFSYQLKPNQYNLEIQITQLTKINDQYIQKIRTDNMDLLFSTAGINILCINNRGFIYLKENFEKEESRISTGRLTSLLKNLQEESLAITTISKNARYNNVINSMLDNIKGRKNAFAETIENTNPHNILLIYKLHGIIHYIEFSIDDNKVYRIDLNQNFLDPAFWSDLSKKNLSSSLLIEAQSIQSDLKHQ